MRMSKVIVTWLSPCTGTCSLLHSLAGGFWLRYRAGSLACTRSRTRQETTKTRFHISEVLFDHKEGGDQESGCY